MFAGLAVTHFLHSLPLFLEYVFLVIPLKTLWKKLLHNFHRIIEMFSFKIDKVRKRFRILVSEWNPIFAFCVVSESGWKRQKYILLSLLLSLRWNSLRIHETSPWEHSYQPLHYRRKLSVCLFFSSFLKFSNFYNIAKKP